MNSDDKIVIDVESAMNPAIIAGGWANLHLCGIGVAVVYSFRDDSFAIYTAEQASALTARLNAATAIFGFLIGAFDLPVIYKTQRTTFAETRQDITSKTFDLWRLCAAGLLYNPNCVPRKGCNLGDIAKATLGKQAGRGKLMEGADAPALWQSRKPESIVRLCNYCLEDVRIERDLVAFALKHGYLIGGDGRILPIGVDPWHTGRVPAAAMKVSEEEFAKHGEPITSLAGRYTLRQFPESVLSRARKNLGLHAAWPEVDTADDGEKVFPVICPLHGETFAENGVVGCGCPLVIREES